MKNVLLAGFLVLAATGSNQVRAADTEPFPDGMKIGSWTTVEGITVGDVPPSYGILARSKAAFAGCDPHDTNCRRSFSIDCSAGRYSLSFLGPCPTCGSRVAGLVEINISIDGTWRQFKLIGRSDDVGMIQASLTPDQVLAISHSSQTIGVGAQGRPYIYVETSESSHAIAMLARFCERDVPRR